MWSKGLRQIGEPFAPPRLLRYRGVAGTPCGIMGPNNAAYCPQANAIFYDELFVAAQAKNAARELGTDGDMAAVGIIAHEMGHAVAIQLGYASRFTYDNESVADCLAGAFATFVVFAWRDVAEKLVPAEEVARIDRANRSARALAVEGHPA